MSPGHSTGGEDAHQDLAGPVLARCRPGPAGWILAVLFAFVGGLGVATAPGSPTDAAGRWFYWCLGAAFLALALVLIAWQLRAQVIADGADLRWRDLGRWRRASWAEVSDYYEKPFPRGRQLIIQTSIGTIKLSVQGWSDLERLRHVVEQHATRTPARTCLVRTGARGITQVSFSGRCFIPWDQVREYHQWGDGVMTFGIVSGARSRIWFWYGIADVEELKDEIARRAINSRTKGWEARPSVREAP